MGLIKKVSEWGSREYTITGIICLVLALLDFLILYNFGTINIDSIFYSYKLLFFIIALIFGCIVVIFAIIFFLMNAFDIIKKDVELGTKQKVIDDLEQKYNELINKK